MQPAPQTTDSAHGYAPWLMLLGVAGMSLALCGLPIPVLTCLLCVGVGADADIARRARRLAPLGGDQVALPVRFLHAALYAVLFWIAWGAMLNVATTDSVHARLSLDLALCVIVLTLRAWRG